MSDLIRQVKEKQKKIREIQKEEERRSGKRDQLLKQLKETHDVDSLEEAKTYLEELEAINHENTQELEKIDQELQKIISSAETTRTAE